ncbi:MAG: MBL fold metallo-hydrolase [Bacteroidia bacterium]|nr:MBL fold metallo-hydrolase [Bacteroidia bacterium]
MSLKQFGGKATKERITRYEASPNWDDGKFQNLIPTSMDMSIWDAPKLIQERYRKRSLLAPDQPLPLKTFDANEWEKEETCFAWYGHSALLLKLAGKTFMIDPMLGPDASPIGPMRTHRFSENSLDVISELPQLDAVFLSHDHYDHLDYDSIQRLRHKTAHFYTALGVGRHLEAWGVQPNQITELDWWGQVFINDLKVTFTPSRHFSGRGLTDRAKSLWGGWVFQTSDMSVYFTGDGGYGPHFKEVGEKLGPFDLGFVECGQYHDMWHDIHMFPEESVMAALDAGIKRSVPVHWCGFVLAMHSWTEPVKRFRTQAAAKGVDWFTPELGEIFTTQHESKLWWRQVAEK